MVDHERADAVDHPPFLALSGNLMASMHAARAGETWRRPG
jgi:hypothetical protein